MIAVLALDLSLTSTGWARSCDGAVEYGVLRTTKRGPERLIALRDRIVALLPVGVMTLVLVEDGVVRSSAAKVLGELHGVVKVALHESRICPALVSPAALKKYATGKGNADKLAVLSAAVQRLRYTGSSGDEADALWLLAIGLEHLGRPLAPMPAVNRDALAKVVWP